MDLNSIFTIFLQVAELFEDILEFGFWAIIIFVGIVALVIAWLVKKFKSKKRDYKYGDRHSSHTTTDRPAETNRTTERHSEVGQTTDRSTNAERPGDRRF